MSADRAEAEYEAALHVVAAMNHVQEALQWGLGLSLQASLEQAAAELGRAWTNISEENRRDALHSESDRISRRTETELNRWAS